MNDEYRAAYSHDILHVIISLFGDEGSQFSNELSHQTFDWSEWANKG